MAHPRKYYVTTPIYYVNDRPHIGHVYTTTVADMVARYRRLLGHDVFFLTGTDEHATKVVEAAAARGMSTQEWADRNAAEFSGTFEQLGLTHDDFIRTSQERHSTQVRAYVQQLLDSGDIYLGEYEGWYDPGQEEYVPENKAKEWDFKSPISDVDLVRRSEQNYLFRLSAYADDLLGFLEREPGFVRPEARHKETVARIREGLYDIPVSRTGSDNWGIRVPGDDDHTIYVWIDALFNYLSTVDVDDRRRFWPADVHLIAKDILWFHAVIWPALLMALGKLPGNDWITLPKTVYAHSFWISEGRKMSKSLGNFIDLEQIENIVDMLGFDALRYYLAINGPMGTSDGDFVQDNLIRLYNGDLANTLGNCLNRICNMTQRYFGGKLPPGDGSDPFHLAGGDLIARFVRAMDAFNLRQGVHLVMTDLVREIDRYIERTEPFKLARDASNLPQVGAILHNCAEGMRIASLCLWPVMPAKVEQIWQQLGGLPYASQLAHHGRGDFQDWAEWGGLKPGMTILSGNALFPRYQTTG